MAKDRFRERHRTRVVSRREKTERTPIHVKPRPGWNHRQFLRTAEGQAEWDGVTWRVIRNGIPPGKPYVYHGTGESDTKLDAAWVADTTEPRLSWREKQLRKAELRRRSTGDTGPCRMEEEEGSQMANTKEVKQLIAQFQDAGCEVVFSQGSKHWKIYDPDGRFVHSMSGTPRKGGMSITKNVLRKIQRERASQMAVTKLAPVKFSNTPANPAAYLPKPAGRDQQQPLLPDLSKAGIQKAAMLLWDEIRRLAAKPGTRTVNHEGSEGYLWSGSRQEVMLDTWPKLPPDAADKVTRTASMQLGAYLKLTGNMHLVTHPKPGARPPEPPVWWVRTAWKPGPDGLDAARRAAAGKPPGTSPRRRTEHPKFSDYMVDQVRGAVRGLAKRGEPFRTRDVIEALPAVPDTTVSSILVWLSRQDGEDLTQVKMGWYSAYGKYDPQPAAPRRAGEVEAGIRADLRKPAERKEPLPTTPSQVKRGEAGLLLLRYMQKQPPGTLLHVNEIARATGVHQTTVSKWMGIHAEHRTVTGIMSPGIRGVYTYIPPGTTVPDLPGDEELGATPEQQADQDGVTAGQVHPALVPEEAPVEPVLRPGDEPPQVEVTYQQQRERKPPAQDVQLGNTIEILGEMYEVYGITMDKIILRDVNGNTIELPRAKL